MRPDYGEFLGSYVRALHDFQTDLPGEISLIKGDVFQVTEVIDKNWLHGKNKDKEGNFPYDFVEKITIPITEAGQKVFAATEKFPASQDGDLDFKKGEVIIGLYCIDEFWWHGRCGVNEGMFPVTHVMELEMPKLLRMRSKSVHSSEPLFAQALVGSNAQLDDELSFQVGDIITVTEVIDEDWYQGECHGKTGMFLASCVQLLNEEECNENSYENNRNVANVTVNNIGPAKVASASSFNSTEQNVKEVDHNEAVSPAYTSENTKSHNECDTGVTPYARTLYPFVGELTDELSFNAHDIVTLIQHVDEQWIEGEIDGKIGVFPANYVEIVVDCPYAYDHSENLQADSLSVENSGKADTANSPSSNTVKTEVKIEKSELEEDKNEHFALVLYMFQAENDQDLSVNEGETVTVLKKIDDNWLLVRNDSDKSGMCPLSFVDIIGAIPDFTNHDKNENQVQKVPTEIKASNEHASCVNNLTEYSKEISNHDSISSDKKNHVKDFKPVSAIKSSSSSSPHVSKTNTSSKPGLKPKPALAPKPALKPKPILSPKPLSQSTIVKSVTIDSDMHKSASSTTLSATGKANQSTGSVQTGSMTKAQSMFEISKTESEILNGPSLTESSGQGSGSNNSVNVDEEKRNSAETKAFQNWDMTKPLDNLLKDEFSRAKMEAEKLSKPTLQNSSSSVETTNSYRGSRPLSEISNKSLHYSVQARQKPAPANYSRENIDFEGFFKVGNSSFIIQDSEHDDMSTKSHLRKPPKPQSKPPSSHFTEFERRPSLKKPAPPRPTGPRIAPAPSRTPLVPVRTHATHSASVNKSMPRKHARPAPPRPQQMKKPVLTKQQADDLISFSPPNALDDTETETEQDSDTVIELKGRIADMENDLKSFQKSKAELEQMRHTLGDKGTGEIHDNIQFYDDNIQGVTEEINNLKGTLAQLSPRESDKLAKEREAEQRKMEELKSKEEMKKKLEEEKAERKRKRIKVIEELIQTEQDFITSMNLIIEVFLSPTTKRHPEVDTEQLFGNIEEVAEVSQKLLTVLEEATQGKDFTEQVIGTCFICMAEDMKNVYAPYCRNHDNVINLIEKYDQNPDTKTYLDGLLDILREKHVVFDLDALLIKPVQRVLKYPLLLNALIKATEDDHPDKQETLSAITAMTDVATAINEYKRRKDLVFKYKKETDASLGDKLAKLNLHSLKKKSSRIRERFSANLGFIDQTRDENFDKEESRFRQLDKTVKVFVKNVQVYVENIQDVVSCQESLAADIEDFYGDKRDASAVEKYQTFHNRVQMTFLPNLQREIDEMVTYPLNQVIQMFEAPSKVIQKRYDKLLDYDNMKRKAQSDRVTEKAVEVAKVNYEALNAQLLEELPRFSKLTFQLLKDCVGSFIRAQREFTDKLTHDMYNVLDLNILHDEGVIDTFNIQHTAIVDKLALLSLMPKSFSPRIADQKQDKKSKRLSLDPSMMKSTEAVPQIDSQRVYVTQQFPANKLFTILRTHVAMDSMDLSVCEGDVVGVIMEKDPMGNKERWFVDSGASKGFVNKNILVPYESSPPRQLLHPSSSNNDRLSPNPSSPGVPTSPGSPLTSVSYNAASNTAVLHSLQEEDDMDFALEEDMTPVVLDQGQGQEALHSGKEEDLELYYAEYAFEARNSNEVSLFEHQVVTVLANHDQDGNKEWWYVDADGTRGYAPALYMRRMDSHQGPV